MGAIAEGILAIVAGLVGCVLLMGLFAFAEYAFRRPYRQPTPDESAESQSARERFAVLRRDGYTCQLCGARPSYVTHYIQPRDKGGTDTRDNMITLCSDCESQLTSQHTSADGRATNGKEIRVKR